MASFLKKVEAAKVTSSAAGLFKKFTITKDDDEPEVVDETRLKGYAQNMYNANVDDEFPPPYKKVTTVEQAIRNIEWAGEEVETGRIRTHRFTDK